MFRTFLTGVFLTLFFLVSLPLYVLIPVIGRFDRCRADHMTQDIVCGALKVVFSISGSSLAVEGLENIPGDEAVMFVSNHRSYFDIICTYPQMKRLTAYVAKQELDSIPLIGHWLRLLHGLTFDRDNPRSGMKMILAAIEQIKEGYSMFLFPEGTRSKDGVLGEFKAGAFKIATRTDCPVVPVAITGTSEIFEDHLPAVRPSKVLIRFGEPVMTAELSNEEKRHMPEMLRQRVGDMLDDGWSS